MIVYSIKLKREGHFQVTDIERAQISTTGQSVVQVVYSNAFRRKTHYKACAI
jgi:hypothetical protein